MAGVIDPMIPVNPTDLVDPINPFQTARRL